VAFYWTSVLFVVYGVYENSQRLCCIIIFYGVMYSVLIFCVMNDSLLYMQLELDIAYGLLVFKNTSSFWCSHYQ